MRGLARVKPFNPDSPALRDCEAVWLKRRADEHATRFEVTQSQKHKQVFLVGLAGIQSLNDLEPWMKSEVSIESATVPDAGEGELYHFEAIGLMVRTTDGEVVGKVVEVMPLPSNDLWVVESSGGGSAREVLIPVVGAIVKEIDLTEGFAVIDPPAGLLEE